MSILDYLAISGNVQDPNVADSLLYWRDVLNVLIQYIHIGSGTPEGAETGSVGHIFLRNDGGAKTCIYVKESGAGTNTGWVAVRT